MEVLGIIPARNQQQQPLPRIRTRICQNCHIPFSYEIGRGKDRKYCSICSKEVARQYHKVKQQRKRRLLKAEFGHCEKFVNRVRNDAKTYCVPNEDAHFASWFSGFFDGEGYFRLRPARKGKDGRYSFGVSIGINLRADELYTLLHIQQYFKCGNIGYLRKRRDKYGIHHPQVVWTVSKQALLYHIFIPHFEKYPLRSRKREHFEVWKQGVKLAYLNQHKTKEGTAKWNMLVQELRAIREFKQIPAEPS